MLTEKIAMFDAPVYIDIKSQNNWYYIQLKAMKQETKKVI